jgi:hypothetical protein
MPLKMLLLLLLATLATGSDELRSQLNCDTSVVVAGNVLPDRNPQYELSTVTAGFVMKFQTAELRNTYYIQLINTSVTVRSFTATGAQATSVKTWTDLLPAILQKPGEITERSEAVTGSSWIPWPFWRCSHATQPIS